MAREGKERMREEGMAGKGMVRRGRNEKQRRRNKIKESSGKSCADSFTNSWLYNSATRRLRIIRHYIVSNKRQTGQGRKKICNHKNA